MNQSRSLKAHALGAELALKRSWVTWSVATLSALCVPPDRRVSDLSLLRRLGLHAFHRVLSRRPGLYGAIATKLQRELRAPKYGGARVHLQKVIAADSTAFADRANGDRKAQRL